MKLMIALLTMFAVNLSAVNAETEPSYDKRLSEFAYPFEVSSFHFLPQGKDLTMAYMYLPAKNQKPTVMLLHGKNFNGAYWEQTANLLQKHGYGVLMPDQIGFGKSSKPVDYQYSFAALASNTRALLRELKLSDVIVVGHSMGGMLASRFALLYPDTTKKLVLVNPIGLENYLRFVEYKDVSFFFSNELNKQPEDIINYQKKHYYDGKWNQSYAELTEPLTGWLKGRGWPTLAMVSALTYDMIFTQPVIEEFQYFEVPVTVILGTRDRTAPGSNWKKSGVSRELGRYDRFEQEIKSRNPDIQVTTLEGLGHLPHIEAFERFEPVFLEAVNVGTN